MVGYDYGKLNRYFELFFLDIFFRCIDLFLEKKLSIFGDFMTSTIETRRLNAKTLLLNQDSIPEF
jgi:hypothetical protein